MRTENSPTIQSARPLVQNENLWDVGDVADFLSVSRSTVRRRVEASTIPYVRIGNLIRFEPDVIRGWVKEQVPEKAA